MENTYWNHNGKYQELSDKLQALIPNSGEVENPRKNKALERFRKASNCYYDLYNNGLCNRTQEFRQVFKVASSHYYSGQYGRFDQELYRIVESATDNIILAAAKEQNITETTNEVSYA